MLRVTLTLGALADSAAGDIAGETYGAVARATLVCANCKNDDETRFMKDHKQGDTVCTRCGLVASDREIHDGDWTRSFEGEESSSQIGPPPNPLLSNRYNLGTGLGEAPGVSKVRMKQLNIMRAAVDMGSGSSGLGNSDKRTRLAYKDRQKVQASEALGSAGELLGLSKSLVDRAKVTFAAFRDSREKLEAYPEALTGCLVGAIEESLYARLQGSAAQAEAEQAELEEGARSGSGSGSGSGSAAAAAAAAAEQPPAAPAPLTAAQLAARQAEQRRRAAEDAKRARVLGQVGSDQLMMFASSGGGGGAGAGSGDSEESEDEESRLLKQLLEQREQAPRFRVSYALAGKSELSAERLAAISELAAASALPKDRNDATKEELKEAAPEL